MSNVIKKVLPGGIIGISPKKKAPKPIEPLGISDGPALNPADPIEKKQTAAQAGAAAARKKRGGRTGQRGLLYASRLGGRGGGRGDIQDTLGPA